MGRIFRALRYRSEQAQYVTYHRQPIYQTDSYGVPQGGTAAAPELLLPDLPAIIRPAITADYQQERAGNNIIGAARIYTPNINTIKNYPNFAQTTANPNFNEIQGWDKLITNYRSILYAETNVDTNWTTTNGVKTTDGESLINTLNNANPVTTYTAPASNVNVLEADRLRLKIKPNFAMGLTTIKITNIDGGILTYTPTTLTVTADAWLTIDLPYITGTVAANTCIYQGGTRYATVVTSTADYNYESNLATVIITSSGGATTNTIYFKEIEFYKSVSWHVHSLKDMTDGYIIFNCVRTAGRDDARRRAE